MAEHHEMGGECEIVGEEMADIAGVGVRPPHQPL